VSRGASLALSLPNLVLRPRLRPPGLVQDPPGLRAAGGLRLRARQLTCSDWHLPGDFEAVCV